jgi:hypothetical protein
VRVLLVSAVAVGAVLSGSAQASNYVYDRELGFVARATLRQATEPPRRVPRNQVFRAYVRCYHSERGFERAFEQRYGAPADRVIAYYAGGSEVYLRNTTCRNVHLFIRGRHTIETSAAFSILLHEVLHRQGVRDERITTCLANDAVHAGARLLGFDEKRAVRARELAFRFTKRYSPPEYRMGIPHCRLLNRRTDWTDHRVIER